MIHLDLSRTKNARQRSGLTRVSQRLAQELGDNASPVALIAPGSGPAVAAAGFRPAEGDWWLTAELFSEGECPGMWKFIRERRCKFAAVFHDAIPLKMPHQTWPQSVARHPEYMKMLAEFDRVFAVSEASRADLIEFWRWQGVEPRASVEMIQLGADFAGQPRVTTPDAKERNSLLCVGILEPRKNQLFLLDICEKLWSRNMVFDLHLVGRVNPHFGQPIRDRIAAMREKWRCLHFHEGADDATMTKLYAGARASVFPTIAEGCGLPQLESLWQGVPCVCSDLPVLRENASAGGCLPLPIDDAGSWSAALAQVLTDDAFHAELARQATTRPLPLWSDSASTILGRLI